MRQLYLLLRILHNQGSWLGPNLSDNWLYGIETLRKASNAPWVMVKTDPVNTSKICSQTMFNSIIFILLERSVHNEEYSSIANYL